MAKLAKFKKLTGSAEEQEADDLDAQVLEIFNKKNEELVEKNKELLSVVDDELNDKVKKLVKKEKILVPIAPIEGKDNLYLIGSVRAFMDVV